MKKYLKFVIALLVLSIFVGTFIFLWKKSQPQPVVYEELSPKYGDIVKTTIVTGKIEPRNEVSVKPQISGIITEILKEAGDQVQQGEVIAKVKVIPDMNQLSQAEARVRLAHINVGQARTDFEREKVLYDKGLVSREEYEKSLQAFNQAITVSLPKTELQPGEEVKMSVTVNAKFLGMSKAQPRVLIITNDTKKPKEVVNVHFEK